jgi:hypothetical protein
MKVAIALFALLAPAVRLPAQDLDGVALSIRPEPGISSDTVTLCRVTATNSSGRSLDARRIVFEARALEGARAVTTARGRFGGILAAGESVETVIGFNGIFERFEVSLVGAGSGASRGHGRRGSTSKKARKGRRR